MKGTGQHQFDKGVKLTKVRKEMNQFGWMTLEKAHQVLSKDRRLPRPRAKQGFDVKDFKELLLKNKKCNRCGESRAAKLLFWNELLHDYCPFLVP